MPRNPGRKVKAQRSAGHHQISIFDMIGYSTLSNAHKDTLRGFLALKPGGTQWRGRDIVPPDTFLATVVDRFEQGCDVPLEIPALTALHGIGAWLLDQNVTIDIQGSVSRPDLWTTILAESGASKTYATRVLQRVMALRRFPEVTTAAQFVADLQEHNRAAWFQDEWGQLLKRINSQTYADEIRDYLLRLYDNATITWRTRSHRQDALARIRRDQGQVQRQIDNVMQAIMRGIITDSTKATLDQLEVRKTALTVELAQTTTKAPALPDDLAAVYAAKVTALVTSLNDPTTRLEATEAVRGLIDRIIVSWDADIREHRV